MELFSLKGKTAIVTGALGLIGKKHCEALVMAGANVVAADLDEKKVEAFAAGLGEQHGGLMVDVTSQSSLIMARDKILTRYGSIDILVNNAAINDMFENPAMAKELSAFENYPLNAFQQSLNVNVTGVFLCSQVFGTVMAQQGSGSIINVASTYGIVGPDQSIYKNRQGEQDFYKSAAYPVTKGAVINFTRFLASYWGNKGVRVNTLSPGGVENNQNDFFVENYAAKTPLGRMAKADDYQGALIFLASDASAYMTGANLVVDGGWTAI
ncbi:SDR family oxidoreductase [Mucilaginibacter pocheonensis]|uniref:NAD(P)-dependent dehydrogenase (Short-subunit alcohol dehydrogenase family) n=1 Tax=Mucilaginibacter pocheonensis TaxID=398050 RepID=A0ABU1THY0_9SPHI|nr:SDR family oxidoreductase [Mucilaginibacter pocheonensis]MDR6944401.1 NAD(P)-dependent dehydrogenase (short-subunit alcohol dehydrogenase family) [Mucilaginibacter pocheonensis]